MIIPNKAPMLVNGVQVDPTDEQWLAMYPPATQDDLYAASADIRWHTEVKGITINGLPVGTDDRSKTLLQGAFVVAQQNMANSQFAVDYIAPNNTTVSLNAIAVSQLFTIVSQYVQTCFSMQANVNNAISNGSITNSDQIVEAFATIPTSF